MSEHKNWCPVNWANHQNMEPNDCTCGAVEAPAPAQPTKQTVMLAGSVPPRLRKYLVEAQTLDLPAQPTPAEPSADCYCSCHSPTSSRPVCLHCKPEYFANKRDPYCETEEVFQKRVAVAPASEEEVARKHADCIHPNDVCCLAAIHEVADPLRAKLNLACEAVKVGIAENVALRERVKELERERDLAVAHDRQPYPTAEAYELVCKARAKWQARAEAVERQLELCQEKLTRWQLFTSGKDQGYNDDTALVEWLDKEITTLFSALQPKAASPEKKGC